MSDSILLHLKFWKMCFEVGFSQRRRSRRTSLASAPSWETRSPRHILPFLASWLGFANAMIYSLKYLWCSAKQTHKMTTFAGSLWVAFKQASKYLRSILSLFSFGQQGVAQQKYGCQMIKRSWLWIQPGIGYVSVNRPLTKVKHF